MSSPELTQQDGNGVVARPLAADPFPFTWEVPIRRGLKVEANAPDFPTLAEWRRLIPENWLPIITGLEVISDATYHDRRVLRQDPGPLRGR